jgi:hypothetical protein
MEKFGIHMLFLFLLLILTKQLTSNAFINSMADEEILNEGQNHVQNIITSYEYDHAPSSYCTKILFVA